MNGLVRSSQLYLKRNASTILTVVGGVGVVTTTVLGIKATPKALKLLDNAEKQKGEKLTKLEKVKVAAPVYIPTILTGVGTLTCIFGAQTLNKRKQASLMSAYALLDSSYKEYKNKVEELYGEGTNDEIREEIAKDKYEKIEIKNNEKLFYEPFSGRYFKATTTRMKEAEYNLNRDIHMQGWCTLNDFFLYLGLDKIEGGDELGWSVGGNYDMYWQDWVDFSYSKSITDDGTEYTMIVMWQEPYPGYDDY